METTVYEISRFYREVSEKRKSVCFHNVIYEAARLPPERYNWLLQNYINKIPQTLQLLYHLIEAAKLPLQKRMIPSCMD